MKFRTSTILIIIVGVVGLLLRLWQLGVVPPSPNWDEVALGYNAYSILHTGKDEYGTFLPAVLRSYDDYKPAVYAYFVIPSIVIFGLNTFAVRFPAVLFGTLAIIAVYFLVKELFGKEEVHICGKVIATESLALLSASLLAISPWHIQFSRIAFESGVGVAFNIFAVLFFLVGLRKPVFLLLSAFCFGIAPSVYQSDKVFTPLLFFITAFLYRKELFKVPKKFLISSVIIGFLVLFPAVLVQLTDAKALARAKGVSIFADQTTFLKESSARILDDRLRGDFVGIVFDNRRVAFAKAIISGYLSHFDLNWLFVTGDLVRHHAPNMGLLYLWEFPFLFVGIYTLLFVKCERKKKLIIFLWFLAAPIPASITSGVPHAVRTLNFLPTFQVFIALGLVSAFFALKKLFYLSYMKRLLIGCLVTVYGAFTFWNVVFYLNEYFVQQNSLSSVDWQYGYGQAIEKIKKIEGDYTKIVVSNQPPLDQSYMFFLFYLRYDPALYQKDNQSNISGGFRENHAFGKFIFRPIDWNTEQKDPSTLYVGRQDDFPDGVGLIEKIDYLNGDTAIELVEG
ncbi:MAG: glycosyltransferase family 39 protein [bacterium]|nr:glycosyltransferase family 39 protein [bacterium]